MNFIFSLFVIVVSTISPSFAAGSVANYQSAPIDRSDFSSLQRGAVIFANYCQGCHSLGYIRYAQIAKDLFVPTELLQERLMYNSASLADSIQTSINPEDALEWFNQALPPDLSLTAKKRGEDWLYAYFRGFYRDSARPTGWNNTVFSGVSMPHVLADLQGHYVADENKQLVLLEAGKLSKNEYNRFVGDLVNFLVYVADPSQPNRYLTGYLIIAFLFILMVFCYFLYLEYWQDIH